MTTRAIARRRSTEEERWERLGAISLRPPTGSAACHVEQRVGTVNPLGDLPLRITLHGTSLVGADVELLDCLRDLHGTGAVDVLCSWGGRWPKTSVAEPPHATIEGSAIDVTATWDGPRWWTGSGWSATTGMLREWDRVRRRVRDRDLGETATAQLLDACAAAIMHLGEGRHLFVCHDRGLLDERDDRFWNGVQIVDLSEAVVLSGVVLRAHDALPGLVAGERLSGFDNRLGTLEGLWHLIDSLGGADVNGGRVLDADAGLHSRTLQLIFARDAVAAAVFGDQGFATGVPATHALSGLILGAHSLFESWAVLADAILALGIGAGGRYPTPKLVGKRAAERHPGVAAALRADPLVKLRHLLATLRHPLAHSGRLDPSSARTLAGPARLTVGLADRQHAAVRAAAKARGQLPSHWGALGDDGDYDPWRLAHRIALETLDELPALIAALAAELGRDAQLVGRRPDLLNYHDVLEARLLGGIGESEALMALDGLNRYPSVV